MKLAFCHSNAFFWNIQGIILNPFKLSYLIYIQSNLCLFTTNSFWTFIDHILIIIHVHVPLFSRKS